MMKIEEAIAILKEFLLVYDTCYEGHVKKYGKNSNIEKDYEATKVLIIAYESLLKEVTQLAIESVEREKKLALLEKIVMDIKENYRAN